VIEAYDIDGAYMEFKDEAAIKQQELIVRINRIFLARREQEQADKQLQAEKEKLDAQKQDMAAQTKLFEERQKAFEKERAEWHEKRKAQEEAEAGPGRPETGQATEPWSEDESGGECGPVWPDDELEDESEDELEDESEDELEDESEDESEDEETVVAGDSTVVFPEDIDAQERLANWKKLLDLVQAETGIKEFHRDDLADLMALARGMYWSARFDAPIRHLAGLVRKELGCK
jgi:hypothetical protein